MGFPLLTVDLWGRYVVYIPNCRVRPRLCISDAERLAAVALR
jgi:hypothetical protein